MIGFIIDKLIYIGNGVEDATVDFKRGINAICGSSNTGKTYIFKCIDFMFAKKDPPKIDEVKPYEILYMVIDIGSDTLITLKRDLAKNSKLFVYRCSYEEINGKIPEEYSCSVSAKESINSFYYSLLGVKEPIYLNESKDRTKQFTVRYLIKYFMLSENSIIEDSFSPVQVRKQYNMRIFNNNAFDFLISNYNVTEKCTQRQGENVSKIGNQLELIDSMISEYTERAIEKESELNSTSTDDIDSIIKSLKEEIANIHSQIKVLTNERIEVERSINKNKIRVVNLDETHQRFIMLDQQYQNEIERYEFIYQGSYLIEQLPKRKCPICDNYYNSEVIDSVTMYEAMTVEKGIINKKQLDLQESINDVITEINTIKDNLEKEAKKLEEIDIKILTLTHSELSDLDQKLSEYIYHKQLVSGVENIREDIERLKRNRTILKSKINNKDELEGVSTVNHEELITKGIKLLCSSIEAKLEKWLYHEKVSVQFDDNLDLIINGKARSSFGKGYRSLIHTAYYIAMFDIMKSVGSPSFNFMVIDSPLTAYTGGEVRENGDLIVSEQTIKDFYDDLQENYKDRQIIIIENKRVPTNSNVHEIHFTRNKNIGRYGLFPVK